MLKTLLRVRFASFSSALMGKEKPKIGKTILMSLLYLYLFVVMAGMSTLMAITTGTSMVALGLGGHFLAVFLLVDFAILFIMSIFETKSHLFDCKDNELLLSMPVKPEHILLSRILTVLIYNLAASLIVMLPAAIVYIVLSGEVTGFIGALLFMLVIPLPATALASAFGYIIAFISKRTRHKTLISVLFTLAFLGVYFYFYSKLLSASDEDFENIGEIIAKIGEALPLLTSLANAILLKPLELSVLLLASLAISAVAYLVLSKFFMAIATDSGKAVRAAYKKTAAKRNGQLTALLSKEYAKILSSSVYLMNAGLGMIIRVVIGVFAIVKMDELREVLSMLLSELPGVSLDSLIAAAVPVVVIMLTSMDTFSASSVSLEGKSFWIMKSMPIDPRCALIAKSLAQFIPSVASSIICSALILIAVGGGVIPWLIAILISVLSSASFALFGTVINVALPKLEFENEAQPIKQSLAVTVVMFGQMLWGMLLIFPTMIGVAAIGGYLVGGIALLLHLIVAAVLYLILDKVSVRRFANL